MADCKRNNTSKKKFIVAPRDVCQSCGNPSGRKFFLTELEGPSEVHRNNVIPTSVERVSILSNIARADSEIADLDEEMARIQQSVALLQERREAVQKYKIQEQSRFAPIRRLPQEILRYIFFQLHMDASVSSSNEIGDNDTNSYVRVINQVSVYWRLVAYSYPLLWSRLQVTYPEEPEAVTVMEPIIKKYIELSQKSPLDVGIFSEGTQHCFNRAHNLTKIIAQSIPRWQSLCCDWPEFLSTHTTFPRLRTLELRYVCHPVKLSSVPELKEIKMYRTSGSVSIQSAPLLSSLELTRSGPLPLDKNFPLSQITHLKSDMSFYDYGQLSDMLAKMPNLIAMNFSGDTKIASRHLIIRLPQLQMITLGGQNPRRRGDLSQLASFTTPNLTTLNLDGEFEMEELLEFLGRSGCYLEELSIKPELLGAHYGAVCFSNIKKLKLSCVHLDHSAFHDVMFWLSSKEARLNWKDLEGSKMYYGAGKYCDDTMFPRLETLHLEGIYFYFAEFTVSGMLSMLTSRLPPGSASADAKGDSVVDAPPCHLKSATIIFANKLVDDVVEVLKAFLSSNIVQQPGVQIKVGYIAGFNTNVPDFL